MDIEDTFTNITNLKSKSNLNRRTAQSGGFSSMKGSKDFPLATYFLCSRVKYDPFKLKHLDDKYFADIGVAKHSSLYFIHKTAVLKFFHRKV